MKNIFKIVLLFLVSLCCINTAHSQKSRVFSCPIFSYSYPTNFAVYPLTPDLTPDIKFHAGNNDYEMSGGYIDYSIDSSISIWDDDMFDNWRNKQYAPAMTLIDCEKVLLTTTAGKYKAIRVRCNFNEPKMGIVNYILINKGCLLIFNIYCKKTISKYSNPTEVDILMKGLVLK